MLFLRYFITATAVAAFFGAAQAADPADQQYREFVAASPASALGRLIEVEVDLSTSSGFSAEPTSGHLELRYRMAFNQIAEGWSWQPQADPAVDDYYRFKFLPLQSVWEKRGHYRNEDKIGEPQEAMVDWRFDYFLAFANLYDFYPREVDDDAGFVAQVGAEHEGHIGMRAKARLGEPVTSESTTFWKATHANPTDFTLKKRYLIGSLEEVSFYDTASGAVICRIPRGSGRCAGK